MRPGRDPPLEVRSPPPDRPLTAQGRPGDSPTKSAASSALDGPNGGSSFDPDDLLARVEGDRDLLAKLVDIFRVEYPRLLASLRHSTEAGDAKGVEETAHAIRGMVGNFSARSVSEAAATLEEMGRAANLTGAGAGVARLERGLDHLEKELVRMVDAASA